MYDAENVEFKFSRLRRHLKNFDYRYCLLTTLIKHCLNKVKTFGLVPFSADRIFLRSYQPATILSLSVSVRLQLHGAIYRPDSFVLMLSYCVNLKAIRYESTSLNKIVADKSHRVIAA